MNSLKKIVFLAFVLILGGWMNNAEAAGNELPLTQSMLEDYTSNSTYFNQWNNSTGFESTDGKHVTNGIGFNPRYSNTVRMLAQYSIQDYTYTTFKSKVSLDGKWTTGNLGETQFVVYADNKKLYSKTFTNLTPAEELKLPIPAGTKSLTLYVLQEKGTQGNHRAIFENPRLTNDLPASPSIDSTALLDIGISQSLSNSLYTNTWVSEAFQADSGEFVARGIGYSPRYSNTLLIHSSFYIADYSYTTLETTVSLDNRWKLGDRGKTEVSIYADDKKIYSETFTNSTKAQKLQLSIPAGTKQLMFYTAQEKGSQGNHSVIFEQPLLTNTLSPSPSFDGVSLQSLSPVNNPSNSVYNSQWTTSSFQLIDGSLAVRGYGHDPRYSNIRTMTSTFYIADYAYPTFSTLLSLDRKWITDDRGTTKVSIYADDHLLYEKDFNNNSPQEPLQLPIPKGTTYLKLQTDVEHGHAGSHAVIFADPILVNTSSKPVDPDFKDWDTKLNVPSDKKWNITFNDVLNEETMTNKNIYITDSNNERIPMTYIINQTGDKKSVVRVIPLNEYDKGETYTLWIKDVKSSKGKLLKKNVKMEFTIVK